MRAPRAYSSRVFDSGPPVENGTLGPRRLPGAPPSPLREVEEVTPAEAIARLRDRCRVEDGAVVLSEKPKFGRRKWTVEEYGYLIVAWLDGATRAEIAEHLGVSENGISDKLRLLHDATAARNMHERKAWLEQYNTGKKAVDKNGAVG